MTGPKGPYKKVKGGLYTDRNGAAVFNAADILRDLEVEDTPDNRLAVMEMLRGYLLRDHPEIEIIFRPPGDPDWRST